MSEPKIHHHLPQSYQAGFCNGQQLWVLDRATGSYRLDHPKRIAAIKHDYTVHRAGGVKDTTVEKVFAQLDGAAVPLLRKLRAGESLTADERQTFAWYLAYFAVRVPRFRRWVNEHETARRKLFDREHLKSPTQLQELIDRSELTEAERAEANAELMFEMLKTEDYSVSLDHNSQVKRLVEDGIEIQPRLHDLDWVVAHASESVQFVTSDNPVVEAKSGEFLTFPIASDTAMMLLVTTSDRVRIVHKDMPDEMVYQTSVAIAAASERLVLARDEDYLRRVVRDAAIEGAPPTPLADIGPPSA
jgi:hypothetical protein